MKKLITAFLITICSSILIISCAAAKPINSNIPVGMTQLPIDVNNNYEWQYKLSDDNNIKIKHQVIPFIDDSIFYEIMPTRYGLFRIVFNYTNKETNEIKYIATYNIEVKKDLINVLSAEYQENIDGKYVNKKPIELKIIENK